MSAPKMARFLPLGFALLCVQLDYFSLNLALPTIAHDLGRTVTDLQWLVSGYMLSLGALLVPAGRTGDILGRKLTLIGGLAVFGLTSLICGLTSDPTVLIASRITQGAGAALIMPTVYTLVSNDSEESERPRILGILLAIAGIGTALGPILGGTFAATVGWRWVFLINVPLAAIAAIGVLRVTDSRDENMARSARSMDWWGLVTVSLGLGSLSFGIDQVPEVGWAAPSSLAPLLVGIGLLGAFGAIELRVARPLINPALLRIRPYTLIVFVGLICNLGLNVFVFLATIDLQNVRGEDAQLAGFSFLLGSVGVALAGPLAGWLCSRFAARLVLACCSVLGGGSLLCLAAADALPLYIVLLGVGGLTCGMGYSVTQIAVQNAVPKERNTEANSFLLMTIIALGGVAVVIASGIVEEIGGGKATAGGIDVVFVGTAIVLILTGGTLLAANAARRRRSPAPPTASAAVG